MTSSGDGPFSGRSAALATMHGKEAAIAPVFAARLGIELVVPPGLDTDALGAFTGEVERPGDMDAVLIEKARLGMRAAGLDLGVASEGSYGPHPQMPFVPAGLEKIVLIDDRSGFIAMEQVFDDAPCYHRWEVRELDEIRASLGRIGFPEQALIVKPGDVSPIGPGLAKGLQDEGALSEAIEHAAGLSPDGRAEVETDMRAHMNPRRMATIARLAGCLAERLLRSCPACGAPGWGPIRVETGLPCSWCGGPSTFVKSEVYGCFVCPYEEARPRSDGLKEADPAHCPNCNP